MYTLYLILFVCSLRVSKNHTSSGGLDGGGMRGTVGDLELFHILNCRLHVCKFTE